MWHLTKAGKAYHKKYNKKWEKKNKRWLTSEHRKKRKQRYKSGDSTAALRKHLYGVTPEEYLKKRKQQKNCCALCGRPERRIHYRTKRKQALSVDHDHQTGKVRDLLCRDCNAGLGLFDENPKLLLKAVQYLKKHGVTQ